MRISTSWDVSADTQKAANNAYQKIISELGAPPDLLIVYSSVMHDGPTLMHALHEAGSRHIHSW